ARYSEAASSAAMASGSTQRSTASASRRPNPARAKIASSRRRSPGSWRAGPRRNGPSRRRRAKAQAAARSGSGIVSCKPASAAARSSAPDQRFREPALSDAAPAPHPISEPRLRIIIPLIVGCAFFMEGLDSTMIAVSIPAMADSLGESPLRLNLVITSYLLSLAVFIPVSGWIADRLGTRRVFCAAVLIFAGGSALCGLATNLPMLIAMRIVQGFGGAMMTPVGRLILLRSFPRAGLVSAMNWMTIPAMIGPMVGPIVGGALTSYASWRWIFFLNI